RDAVQADTDTPGASAPGERAAVAKALHGRVGRADSVPLNAYRRRPAALRTSDPLTPNVSATTASHGVPLPAAFNHSATMTRAAIRSSVPVARRPAVGLAGAVGGGAVVCGGGGGSGALRARSSFAAVHESPGAGFSSNAGVAGFDRGAFSSITGCGVTAGPGRTVDVAGGSSDTAAVAGGAAAGPGNGDSSTGACRTGGAAETRTEEPTVGTSDFAGVATSAACA